MKRCVLCGKRTFIPVLSRPQASVAKCTSCGLVQVVPMPTPAEIASLYHEDLEHFDPYVAQIPVHRQYFRKKVREVQQTVKGKKLLDIGCAMGILLEEAKKIGFRVQGVDISKDAVLYCRKKGLSVSQTWPKTHFDVVTAFELIEHEQSPLALMRRVHALLNKGGIAVLTTPNHSGNWRKIMGTWWVGYRHPEHVTFWDPVSIWELFRRAGFTDVHIRRDDPRPFPLSFLFTRSADYFPWAAWILRPLGKLFDKLDIINPINPWDDLIVIGRKD